jgi:UTP--glucose-1-phosphate uridylyltransferase
MTVRKAVIPAAGLGTRVLPATKVVPKEMLPLADKPAIQYLVEEAVASGARQITVVTSRTKRAIEDHFDETPELLAKLRSKGAHDKAAELERVEAMAEMTFVRQPGAQGLGHAILMARPVIGEEPFGVLLGDDLVDNGDDPCLAQLIRAHERYGGCVLAVMRVPREQVGRYGVVAIGERLGERAYRVTDLVEKPAPEEAPSNLIIIGRYVLTPGIFRTLERTQPGAGGEIQLTDAIRDLLRTEHVLAYEFAGVRYDTGDPVGLLTTSLAFALKRPDLAPGVIAYLKTLKLD